MEQIEVTPRKIADYLESVKGWRCNCDLDNWEPTKLTGHSHVCRIHKTAAARPYDIPALIAEVRASVAAGASA